MQIYRNSRILNLYNHTTTIGVYDPATATFYERNSNSAGPAANTFQYGNANWVPLAGDWDGNSYWGIGVYDPTSAIFYLRNSNTTGGADITVQYGNIGMKPVVGDWDAH
ncbi:MAG TPA: hypothetical protein VGO07_07050 [Candidatus Saccharimonadales bacterium]|nr:hypothetical protein [Candidatus Saccharimonadales bacterium]